MTSPRTLSFTDAMRAVRRGWVSGDADCRLVSLGAMGVYAASTVALLAYLPEANAITVPVSAVSLLMQLRLVATMPERRAATNETHDCACGHEEGDHLGTMNGGCAYRYAEGVECPCERFEAEAQ